MAKSVKLKFRTDAGKDYSLTMAYADPALAETGGAAKVQAALDAVIAQQPFTVTIASSRGAELIDRTVTDLI